MDDIRPLFENNRTFAGLRATTLDILVGCARRREVAVGETLFHQDAPREACFLIASGQIEILRVSEDRLERLALLGPGQAVGEGAFLHASQHSATARAVTDASLVELPRSEVHARLAADGEAAIEVLSRVALVMNRRLLYASSARGRPREGVRVRRDPARARPARRARRPGRRPLRRADPARRRELPHHRHAPVPLPGPDPRPGHGQAGGRPRQPQARPARRPTSPMPSTAPARRSSTATGTATSSSTWCRAAPAPRPT